MLSCVQESLRLILGDDAARYICEPYTSDDEGELRTRSHQALFGIEAQQTAVIKILSPEVLSTGVESTITAMIEANQSGAKGFLVRIPEDETGVRGHMVGIKNNPGTDPSKLVSIIDGDQPIITGDPSIVFPYVQDAVSLANNEAEIYALWKK